MHVNIPYYLIMEFAVLLLIYKLHRTESQVQWYVGQPTTAICWVILFLSMLLLFLHRCIQSLPQFCLLSPRQTNSHILATIMTTLA